MNKYTFPSINRSMSMSIINVGCYGYGLCLGYGMAWAEHAFSIAILARNSGFTNTVCSYARTFVPQEVNVRVF